MVRKMFCLGLVAALLLTASVALAAPSFSDKLFGRAKDAVSLISYGEYEKAVETLGLSMGASELEEFVSDDLSDIFYVSVQKEVSVAYYTGKRWIVAVPIEEPSDDNVMALALSSSDGSSFDAYRAMNWGDVMKGVNQAEESEWNVAYEQGEAYLVPDN